MEAAVQEQSIDSLASLEERITRAVQVITHLRNENSQIHKEKDDLAQQVKRLSEELNELRGERKQVRSRIEKLLSQLDLLSAS
jgi:FtsZ-binding cell division protein ZapB